MAWREEAEYWQAQHKGALVAGQKVIRELRDDYESLLNIKDDVVHDRENLAAVLQAVSTALLAIKRPHLDPDGKECAVETIHLIANDIQNLLDTEYAGIGGF